MQTPYYEKVAGAVKDNSMYRFDYNKFLNTLS